MGPASATTAHAAPTRLIRRPSARLLRLPRLVISSVVPPSLILGVAMAAGITAGLLATNASVASHAVSEAGADLTRLLRAMALMKAMMAAAGAAAIFWRARTPVSPVRCAAYALALAAMGAGPGLIWRMAHVASGALLLHGGLIAALLLLWRDPEVGSRLAALVAARRLRHGAR